MLCLWIANKSLESKDLYIFTDFCVYTGDIMATFTISAPKELERLRKEYPEINWNEVMKRGILKRLEELKKFEALKTREVSGSKKFEEFFRKLKTKRAV